MTKKIRKPAVAGQFYPQDEIVLKQMISSIESKESESFIKTFKGKKIIGGIVPHAGYIYSGYQAVHFFNAVKMCGQQFDTVVILNPNHSGYGPDIALDENDEWSTPLGNLKIDRELYSSLDIKYSSLAHSNEHSAEVMLPLIQYYFGNDVMIAPISINNQTFDTASELAKSLQKAAEYNKREILIIASSDFSHYISPEAGFEMDELVCSRINEFDARGVFDTIKQNNISVCGYGPIMALIEYSKMIKGEVKTEILRRGNSGETSPSNRVVDYITILFYTA